MLRITFTVALFIIFTGNTSAAEPKAKGFYIGGGGGQSVFVDGGAIDANIFDDSDTAYQIHAGYKFFKYLAVEARYADFGTFGVFPVNLDVSATSAHVVGILPFGSSGWELFGQLGFASVEFDTAGFGGESDAAATGGIGVRFSATENLAIGIQTDAYVWEETTFSQTYDMGFGSTQVTLSFMF